MENLRNGSGNNPFDVYIVGTGIMGITQMTRETEQVIRDCKQVFYVDHGFGIADFLKSLCPKVTNLLHEYKEGQNRLITYRHMAAAVVNAALEETPVCFATYGHPTMYVYPSVLIRKAAAMLGLRLKILPGVSMFDTAIIDLAFDPGLTGLQMYEATSVLVEHRQLHPDVPCLLLQVDTVESAIFTRSRNKIDRFQRLQDYLLKFYPPDHTVISVFSATFPILEPILNEMPLKNLAAEYVKGIQSGTLFIPGIKRESFHRDELLEKQIYDPEYLSSITVKRK